MEDLLFALYLVGAFAIGSGAHTARHAILYLSAWMIGYFLLVVFFWLPPL